MIKRLLCRLKPLIQAEIKKEHALSLPRARSFDRPPFGRDADFFDNLIKPLVRFLFTMVLMKTSKPYRLKHYVSNDRAS